ncbi:MAG TPA: prepilin-type N-terminal cleavage/methylation domain-containing protein [Myxococcota bacterium]|nr:prepilin-type N-terminal cleavage/methylation domain-containing protein [Myxococcota bacterium]
MRRSGFTLIELLVVVALLGVLALVGYPKVSNAMTKTNLRSARGAVANMVTKARIVATQRNRTARVNFDGNTVFVTADGRTLPGNGSMDTLGGLQNLSTLYGATLVAPGLASIAYDPRGFRVGVGSDTLRLTRNGQRDSLVVDAMGRVRK